ncbi:serine/threonine protein kinase [Dictyobacter kobayashii]|nr:protein kinase [Dictyobacter kobayashii]
MQYEPQAGSKALFCLGHPSHALQPEEVVCRVCDALAAHTTLGIYEVQKLLGIGRSGHAYQAIHQRSGQPVAIKLFPAFMANPELWEAARREVRVTTALRHSSILSVFSCSTWSPEQLDGGSGAHYEWPSDSTSMYLLTLCQYIPGTLSHFVNYLQKGENQQALYEHGSSPRALVIHVLQQIGSALATAHARGIAHGALVPGNILFSSYERVWVADFGLARLQPPPAPYLPPELYAAAQASQQGNVQAYWKAANPASDQYMFAMLCQQLLPQTLQKQDYEPLLPVLNRAIHPKPERRYPSLQLLIQDLVALTGRPAQPQLAQQFKQPRWDHIDVFQRLPVHRQARALIWLTHGAIAIH